LGPVTSFGWRHTAAPSPAAGIVLGEQYRRGAGHPTVSLRGRTRPTVAPARDRDGFPGGRIVFPGTGPAEATAPPAGTAPPAAGPHPGPRPAAGVHRGRVRTRRPGAGRRRVRQPGRSLANDVRVVTVRRHQPVPFRAAFSQREGGARWGGASPASAVVGGGADRVLRRPVKNRAGIRRQLWAVARPVSSAPCAYLPTRFPATPSAQRSPKWCIASGPICWDPKCVPVSASAETQNSRSGEGCGDCSFRHWTLKVVLEPPFYNGQ
jgi:hypothetical protein